MMEVKVFRILNIQVSYCSEFEMGCPDYSQIVWILEFESIVEAPCMTITQLDHSLTAYSVVTVGKHRGRNSIYPTLRFYIKKWQDRTLTNNLLKI